MFIHIGNNILVNGGSCVGIFNIETLRLSDENSWLLKNVNDSDKTLSLDINNTVVSSEVSPFTIIKRDNIKKEELYWSKK